MPMPLATGLWAEALILYPMKTTLKAMEKTAVSKKSNIKLPIKSQHMERLYKTQLSINGRQTTYEVIFENEQYVFHPQGSEGAQTFSIKREEDEWHPQTQLEEGVQEEAIASLESYLLSQH